MKGKNLLLMAFFTLVAGIVMILFRNTLASNNVVIGAGILFILAGIANMTVFLGSRDKNGRARMGAVGTVFGWVASGAALVLGVVMILFRTVFEVMVGYMFGILLVCCALFQFFLLLFGSKPVKLTGWFFLVPMILCGIAVYIFVQQPGQADLTIMLTTGIGLAFFGLMTFVESAAISSGNRSIRKSVREYEKGLAAGKAEDAEERKPDPAPAAGDVSAKDPEALSPEKENPSHDA